MTSDLDRLLALFDDRKIILDSMKNYDWNEEEFQFIKSQIEKEHKLCELVKKRIQKIKSITGSKTDIDWGRDSSLGEFDKEHKILQNFLTESGLE